LVSRGGSAFFSYTDPYDRNQPYAYFSSYGSRNGYNRYYSALPPNNISDCNGLGVWPYAEATLPSMRYLNPETFQIISAGDDGTFGQGSNLTLTPIPTWTRTAAASSGCIGADDQSNFYDNKLGINY